MNKVLQEQIEKSILVIRSQRVMLDKDLAHIYGVTTKYLNQQESRNIERFPQDFMFQVSENEEEYLRLQFATSKSERGGRRYLPFVFAEHGAVMLSAVLKSPIAIETSIQIVRAFHNLRKVIASNIDLARKLEILERKYDHQFKVVFDAIRELSLIPEQPRKRIGIKQDD